MPEGSILNLLFLNLIPGIASLILAKQKKANNIVLTIILGGCLLENLTTVIAGSVRFSRLLNSAQIPTWYLISSQLLRVCLPLVVCLIMSIFVLKNPERLLQESPAREKNSGKKGAGISRIVTGALLATVAAVGTIILLLYLLDGVFSVQYVFFYLMSVFAAVLIISGVISVRVAFGKREYIISEIYSFFIIVVYFTKGMLQILLSWKAYGGGFLQGPGSVVIVRGAWTIFLICAFLWYLVHLIVLITTLVEERKLKKQAG